MKTIKDDCEGWLLSVVVAQWYSIAQVSRVHQFKATAGFFTFHNFLLITEENDFVPQGPE